MTNVERIREVKRLLATANTKDLLQMWTNFEAAADLASGSPTAAKLCRPLMLKLAGSRQSYLRGTAAESIFQLGNARDYQLLKTLLADKNDLVRSGAIESVNVCGERLALPLYRHHLLHDKSELVRLCAARSISNLDQSPKLRQLVDEGMKSKIGDAAKGGLATTLFMWDGQEALEAMVDCFKSDHYLCYMRPVWHFSQFPEDLDKLDQAGSKKLRHGLITLAEELEAEECPAWQAKRARELASKVQDREQTLLPQQSAE